MVNVFENMPALLIRIFTLYDEAAFIKGAGDAFQLKLE
jgi:hypothetical protein